MSQYVAGFSQSVTIGSNINYNITNGNWTESNSLQEVSGTQTSGANGKMAYIAGLSSVSGSFDLVYDLQNPLSVSAGQSVSISNLIGSTGTQGFTCATCFVSDRAYTTPIGGVATVTISFQSSGPYTISLV
jgi:hypothetical protein